MIYSNSHKRSFKWFWAPRNEPTVLFSFVLLLFLCIVFVCQFKISIINGPSQHHNSRIYQFYPLLVSVVNSFYSILFSSSFETKWMRTHDNEYMEKESIQINIKIKNEQNECEWKRRKCQKDDEQCTLYLNCNRYAFVIHSRKLKRQDIKYLRISPLTSLCLCIIWFSYFVLWRFLISIFSMLGILWQIDLFVCG